MANSSDKENNDLSADFADDLDAMLNDAESSMDEQEDSIADEDAIDRLLMDDVFNEKEEDEFSEDDTKSIIEDAVTESKENNTEANSDVDDLINSVASESENDKDELIENKPDDMESEDEFDVDDLINSVVAEPENEADEFAEIDEFSEKSADEFDVDDLIDSATAPAPETKKEKAADNKEDDFDVDDLINSVSTDTSDQAEKEADPDDDFLIADFDISSDDDVEENEESTTDELADESVKIEEKLDSSDGDITPEVAPNIEAVEEQSTEKLDALSAKISLLWEENEHLKQQIKEVAESTEKTGPLAEEIDSLQKDQRKFRKLLKENEHKVPVITYVAMGIAIFALLMGGGLGAVGYGAQSEVTELTELVITLEEEIDIITKKNLSKDVSLINKKLTALSDQDQEIKNQLVNLDKSMQKTAPLQSVIDDLVVQNNHAQEAIEQLLAKVGTLEQRKFISASKKKAKKAIVKVKWVVNLVSFKQQWYANRKAGEYEKKGIPAKVVQVKVNGENWFRLTVIGFKTKYAAAAYAVKVKKTLNLTEVWVTKG